MQTQLVFPTNPKLDQTNYYTIRNGFDTESLEWVKNLSQLFPFKDATVIANTAKVDTSIRKSKIKWLTHNDKSAWLYDKLLACIQQANTALWGFDLHAIMDSIQYTEYHADGGHYGWHTDNGPHPINHRKVSVTVQLSAEEDYKGGEFLLWNRTKPQILPKRLGSVIMFPSYMLHRVTPVTKGVRRSLVLWAGGGTYK